MVGALGNQDSFDKKKVRSPSLTPCLLLLPKQTRWELSSQLSCKHKGAVFLFPTHHFPIQNEGRHLFEQQLGMPAVDKCRDDAL